MSGLAAAQKPGHGVPAYTRYVNRWAGRRLAAAAHVIGLTPNVVTVLSGAVSMVAIGAVALVRPSGALAVLVAGGLLLGYALDSADGQLARLRGGGSASGEWLDHVVDSVRLPALHVAIVVGLHRFTDLPEAYLLVPLGYLVVSTVRFFANMLTEQLLTPAEGRTAAPGATREASRRSLVRSLVLLPSDYGTLCALLVMYGWPRAFAWAYGLLFAVNALWLGLTLFRRYTDVARLAPS